jgi:hypothetical protein
MVRVVASKALRVQPGDEVLVRAELKPGQKLGRLFVFARELAEDRFSPYVQGMYNEYASTGPIMHTPMSLRLVEAMPSREISFVADIDGFVCIMQENDLLIDPKANVKIKRIIPYSLGWNAWLTRKLAGIFQWQTKILT